MPLGKTGHHFGVPKALILREQQLNFGDRKWRCPSVNNCMTVWTERYKISFRIYHIPVPELRNRGCVVYLYEAVGHLPVASAHI